MKWGDQLSPRTAGSLVQEVGVFLWVEIETHGGIGRWVETPFLSVLRATMASEVWCCSMDEIAGYVGKPPALFIHLGSQTAPLEPPRLPGSGALSAAAKCQEVCEEEHVFPADGQPKSRYFP